ncbi:DUF4249 domain-containing protein [Flavobacterium hercynium]|uniref:DUF4249 domain-containing protein n=1 Tax=Flavobacterium hercynium TaxID=387094 RepID=A0A226GZ26_9FLAO|nr:DUF4249 domain-containing protein [Flavobacterium hercynium]OXA87273.1 hypothetical protein B0A66_16810 [Flavobacterium hercynium]SMP19544.1 protein of unknown function [Flavobacterium hercynium]
MKKIFFLVLLLTPILFTNCTEPIDLELDNDTPKLVVDAFIDWKKGTSGEIQVINLTRTSAFYDKEIHAVSGATVFIKNSLNEQFDFFETEKKGKYLCTSFKPATDETYTLTVINNGQTYVGTETMTSVTPVTRVERKTGPVEKEYASVEVKAYFNDPKDVDNFYMLKVSPIHEGDPSFTLISDELFKGKEYFNIHSDSYYVSNDAGSKDKRKSESSSKISADLFKNKKHFNKNSKKFFEDGDEDENQDDENQDDEDQNQGPFFSHKVTLTNTGISERYYNYLKKLQSIVDNIDDKFKAPSVRLKGNMKNITEKGNYPLGYFSVNESEEIVHEFNIE